MIETETSSTVAQPVASSHPKTEERRAVATAPTETAPPRNKKDDIPFPIVYFGFIAAFLLVNGGHMWSILPPLKEHLQTSFPPEARTVALPAFAFFVMCPLLYLWRGVVKGRLFSYIAKHWAGLKPKTMKHEKFCEQAWLAVHYSIATSFGYYVLRDKPWFPPAVSESAQHALLATRQEREADQKDLGLCALYAIQLGFYTLELVTLMTTKHRRSDATMYFFHHIFTLYLMAGSWVSYNHRIGSIVLFLHDVGDIFLPIGKCYTYAESHIRETQTRAQYNMHKNIGMFFFVMFVIAFAIPRLVVYGAVVYQGFTKYRWFSCCGFDASRGVCGECVGQENNSLYSTTLLSVLGLLYPMHVYWFYLIVKMAVRLVLFPGKYEDVRSDDEDVKTD